MLLSFLGGFNGLKQKKMDFIDFFLLQNVTTNCRSANTKRKLFWEGGTYGRMYGGADGMTYVRMDRGRRGGHMSPVTYHLSLVTWISVTKHNFANLKSFPTFTKPNLS